MIVFTLMACHSPAPEGGPPVLHRLTEPQVDNSLRDLFVTNALPALDLPRDVPIDGFDNNALTRDATPFLVESLQRDIVAVTQAAVTEGGPWLSCTLDASGEAPASCGHDTLTTFLQRAWRRPATAEETAWILGLFDSWYTSHGFSAALQLSLQTVLQSPDFLYLVEVGEGRNRLTDWEIASKLSYALWDSMPDAELFDLASRGQLQNRRVVRDQARRLLRDPRSRVAMRRFLRQWLGYEGIQNFSPDPDAFFGDVEEEDVVGGNVTVLRLSFEEEFDRFLHDAVWGQGTLDAILTSRNTYVSRATATLYGIPVPDTGGFRIEREVGGIDVYDFTMYPVQLDPNERAGFFTTGAFLGSHSHALQPSPVLRSVFLRERLLCIDPIPPPDDVPALEDEADDATWTTNRERFAEHTDNPACAGCHIPIDGMGFPFESYDALGRHRTVDNGAPVDTSGELVGTDVDGPVADAIELIESLAVSRQAYDCAVTQVFRYGMHRSETDADQATLAALQKEFFDNGGVIPDLLVSFVTSDAFLSRGGAR